MRRYWAIVALLVAAVLLVTLAITYGLLNLGRPQPAPAPAAAAPPVPEIVAPETKRMLLAARYLSVGTLLGEADVVPDALEVGRIPAGAVPESSADDIIGTAVRVPIDAGMPVLFTDLVHPGARGFLSLILSPGMRAVSVNIGPATRHAGLIDPGDRVDVIFTASAPSTEGLEVDLLLPAMGGARLSRVVFEDLRVLAIDRTVRPPGRRRRGTPPTSAGKSPPPRWRSLPPRRPPWSTPTGRASSPWRSGPRGSCRIRPRPRRPYTSRSCSCRMPDRRALP